MFHANESHSPLIGNSTGTIEWPAIEDMNHLERTAVFLDADHRGLAMRLAAVPQAPMHGERTD